MDLHSNDGRHIVIRVMKKVKLDMSILGLEAVDLAPINREGFSAMILRQIKSILDRENRTCRGFQWRRGREAAGVANM